MASLFRSFVQELKRRKVFQVGSLYLLTAWGASQGAVSFFPVFNAPPWAVPLFIAFAVLGFPIAIVLAWAFDVTPEGVVRDSGTRKQDENPPTTTTLFGANGVVRVKWRDATGQPQERSFDRGFMVGRDASCAIRFDDALVSRRHAEVSFAGGLWWVADLGSRNGTLLDGQRVQRQVLPSRGVIRLSEAGPILEMELKEAVNTTTLAPRSS
jgi:hypothetical protein